MYIHYIFTYVSIVKLHRPERLATKTSSKSLMISGVIIYYRLRKDEHLSVICSQGDRAIRERSPL